MAYSNKGGHALEMIIKYRQAEDVRKAMRHTIACSYTDQVAGEVHLKEGPNQVNGLERVA
jgi:hypothetical protein